MFSINERLIERDRSGIDDFCISHHDFLSDPVIAYVGFAICW
jgi:hypothetical protein